MIGLGLAFDPLERAGEAYARMMQGKPRLHMVLVTGQ
jgi:hypothetical protein